MPPSTGAGGTAAVIPADVGDRGQVESAFGHIRERLGPVDLIVASAGVGKPTFLDPINVADVEEMVRVNLMGVVYTLSAALPEMIARKTGHLVAVSRAACAPPRPPHHRRRGP